MPECCKEWQNDINESNNIYFSFFENCKLRICPSSWWRAYKILLKLCNNDFAVPVAKRTNIEKAAVVKFWRSKGKFENIDNVLYYDGRKVKKIYLVYFWNIFLCIGYFAINNINQTRRRAKKFVIWGSICWIS